MTTSPRIQVVTGAFGYTGRHLTPLLLGDGIEVRTLTGKRPDPDPFGGRVRAFPFDFERPEHLVEHLRGAEVLYNTYWVRFDHGDRTFARAVRNTELLFDTAKRAGVERIVHVSITRPALGDPLPYFAGKAHLERTLRESGLSYAIVRPTVLFGGEDVLVNNIAWLLRVLPVFGVPGRGDYPIQPVHVDDLAALMARLGRSRENVVLDAVGPEIMGFREMVRRIRRAIGVRTPVLRMPAALVRLAAKALGPILGDVVLTPDEVSGLSRGLLVSSDPPTCETRFTTWLDQNAAALGRRYTNELVRHYRRPDAAILSRTSEIRSISGSA